MEYIRQQTVGRHTEPKMVQDDNRLRKGTKYKCERFYTGNGWDQWVTWTGVRLIDTVSTVQVYHGSSHWVYISWWVFPHPYSICVPTRPPVQGVSVKVLRTGKTQSYMGCAIYLCWRILPEDKIEMDFEWNVVCWFLYGGSMIISI